MARRILRKSLAVDYSAEVLDLSPETNWRILLGEEGEIIKTDLQKIEMGGKILKELNIYLRGFRKKRNVANGILPYLMYVANSSGIVCASSLMEYKNKISNDPFICNSTKYQKFNRAKHFVKSLMKAEVVRHEELPIDFETWSQKKPKRSFPEIARYDLHDLLADHEDFVLSLMDKFKLERLPAESLAFSSIAMDLLHQEALSKITSWEADFEFVNSLIKSLTEDEIKELQSVFDFNSELSGEQNDVEAFYILFSKYGSEPPSSYINWPTGLYEVLNRYGWSLQSIRGVLRFESLDSKGKSIELALRRLSKKQKQRYAGVSDYRLSALDKRSVESAIKYLYCHFGRLLPASEKWPKGLSDYLKKRGWGINRVRSAFFPTVKTIEPYVVASLSHVDLALNVDSSAFYTYLDSFRVSDERDFIDCYVGKYRGEELEAQLDKQDEYLQLLLRHVERMTNLLNEIESGKAFLYRDRCPLFLQFTPCGGIEPSIRLVDPHYLAGIVRRFVKRVAVKHEILTPLVDKASGENFRPTIALMNYLTSDNVYTVKKLLGHRFTSTTDGYIQGIEANSTLKLKHMDFQKIVISEARAAQKRTGNGYLCNEELACGDLDMCFKCDAKRVVLTSPELAAEWIVWEKEIAANEQRLKFNNKARWDKYWSVKLVEYRALISKTSAGVLAAADEIAQRIVIPILD